jgi:hypothetical protein
MPLSWFEFVRTKEYFKQSITFDPELNCAQNQPMNKTVYFFVIYSSKVYKEGKFRKLTGTDPKLITLKF